MAEDSKVEEEAKEDDDDSLWEDIDEELAFGEDESHATKGSNKKKKYFRDDSAILNTSTMRQRRQVIKDADAFEMKPKRPMGKDKEKVIQVQVPVDDDSGNQSTLIDDFVFTLDKTGKNYEYQFGHARL